MTQSQLDYRIFEVKNLIADKFVDLQMYAKSLSLPEGDYKVTLKKMQDTITEINRYAYEVENLESVCPNGDENDEQGVCYM